jgi:hypothetical protein
VSSQLAAFHKSSLKMSDPELHEITFNRAKEEPVPASFSGVVLLSYQNNLCTASTKIAPYGVRGLTLIYWPVLESALGASVERLAAGERSVSKVKRSAERRKERSDRSQPPNGSAAQLRCPQARTNARGARWSQGRQGAITARSTRWFRRFQSRGFAPSRSLHC